LAELADLGQHFSPHSQLLEELGGEDGEDVGAAFGRARARVWPTMPPPTIATSQWKMLGSEVRGLRATAVIVKL
jgi:hypothetical protein